MSFLAPFYALAALAIAAPIIAHLVRKRPKDKIEFSSSLFLEKDIPRLTKSSQIDQWWLLLLRGFLILLVAAAFARPYWNTPTASDAVRSGTRRILMVDISASMMRDGVMDQARRRSLEWIQSAQPEDLVAVYGFHRELVPAFGIESSMEVSPGQRQALAKDAVNGLEATWFGTNFGRSVRSAVELLGLESERGEGSDTEMPDTLELVIVSDFQQGGQYDELASIEWPKGLVVRQIVVGVQEGASDNAFVRVLQNLTEEADENDTSQSGGNESPRSRLTGMTKARVTNLAQSRVEALKLGWVDQEGKIIGSTIQEVLVSPGQSRNVTIESMPANAGSLRLIGDRVEFDNEFYCSPMTKVTHKIVCLTNRNDFDEKSAEFFLQQLPLGGEFFDVDFQVRELGSEWGLDPQSEKCVFLIGLPPESSWARIKDFIQTGGALFWLLDSSVSDTAREWEAALSWLSEGDIAGVSEGKVGDFRLLQDIDFGHYLFSEFADAKFSDFTKVRFWKQRDIELRAENSFQILARFDHGKPALLRRSLGKGNVVIMASGWQPSESQFALSSKFLPLILRYIQGSLPEQIQGESLLVGDELRLEGPCTLRTPDGGLKQITAGQKENWLIQAPGNYLLSEENGVTRTISANLSPLESQLTPIEPNRLLQWGVPLDERRVVNPSASMLRQMRAVELESQQGSWRWLLGLVIVAAAFESTLAWLRSYRRIAAT
ncbi:BatA domain-containing protein [Pirellulaceae bacterium SH449]